MELILIFWSLFLFLAAFITLLPFDHWVVRIFDFPKVQLLVLSAITLILWVFILKIDTSIDYFGIIALCLSIIFHLYRVVPYSPFFPKEVIKCTKEIESNSISLLASNVLTENSNYQLLINQIEELQPDLVLTLESDERWEKALSTIEKMYPHTAKVPQDNLYGMHFYSKLPVKNLEVRYLFKEGIPSIKCKVQLANQQWVMIYGLHPKPPSPTEAPTSTYRDAELLKVGKEVSKIEEPTIVFGDLNDVAWSKSTSLFRKISGLVDPRIGRGRYCTFHADYKLFRWPLDHLFHSKDFCLVNLKVLPSIGSDHFPIYAKLQLSSLAEQLQEAPKADEDDEELAEEKIEKAECY